MKTRRLTEDELRVLREKLEAEGVRLASRGDRRGAMLATAWAILALFLGLGAWAVSALWGGRL